jgi:hypothetical protein
VNLSVRNNQTSPLEILSDIKSESSSGWSYFCGFFIFRSVTEN